MTRWQDTSLSPDERANALRAEMTIEEKVAQLGSAWPGNEQLNANVAPMQDVFARGGVPFEQVRAAGIGHLTRVFGTAPVTAAEGAERVAALQREIIDETRLGVPAIVHEECLTGFTTLGATVYPSPLAWAATFEPALVERMSTAIAEDIRAVGVHQGLSPVLDVVRDYRWGRVEETLGEDPYLVGMMGSAYVRGLETTGIVATLKHFAGYSASRAARNHAPVSIGPREFRDVILPPFEMSIRDGGARSVMNAYVDLDGVPVAANTPLLTGVLRDEWGFDGVVVSDYWAIAFLKSMHRVTDSVGGAGALALAAGIDVELPDTLCYGKELIELVRSGEVPESLVDRSVHRLLRQKAELGLLDPGWAPKVEAVDLDSPRNRAIAREIAEKSVVLLANDRVLPLRGGKIAVVGPCADDPLAFMGCYSYPNHVLPRFPEFGIGVEAPSLVDSLRAELPGASISLEAGCPIRDEDRSGFAEAVAAADEADVCIVVVGDRAGLFGEGTSGEGCDAEDLSLPGVQDELVAAVLATSTPVIVVVVSGRPYALGRHAGAAALVQAFMPGEEGGPALAGILSGRVAPSGRLPVQVPRVPGGSPGTYLHPPLGGNSEGISNLDPTPLFPFGHGISYTTYEYSDLSLSATEIPSDGSVSISVTVRNAGDRAGAEVVQLYLHDVQAQVTRPVLALAGFARVALEAGESKRVTFGLHADRTGFTGLDLRRIVEPGRFKVHVGRSATDLPCSATFDIVGPLRDLGPDRVLTTPATTT
ncbi:beta-xylosidase/alpha-l-arabinosidase [Amycolatopsis alkalitolerans]|uniref:Exo-alpha-(1->6)-L-arabinopyranosidase n=1 Tax=Amycolatopsis alkalitolerans TaxID=2547244 RepID=A0A5C4LTD3_9PSEU|nr:glycoside hydrolase family 3 N-terminal domain-containing protein [Amycolatopsis alkalitolerans]TNC22349.1 glycosyl hydrolase [Amycolatopsis alkalitolerans]